MPITHDLAVAPIDRNEFHERDYQVMGIAFAVQKDLGRLCDESIYQAELAQRCRDLSIGEVVTEAAIHVTHADFEKIFYVDLLVGGGLLYELKAVSGLTDEHQAQTLTYLLLLGLSHGKLINFRPASVTHRFVSTRLTPSRCRQYVVHLDRWQELTPCDARWKSSILDLVDDWGLFLEVDLYCEAATHFLGGEAAVVKRIELVRDRRRLGFQRAHLLADDVAFRISAVTREVKSYEHQLRRLLSLTRLKAIQWVNFCHHDIVFQTLLR